MGSSTGAEQVPVLVRYLYTAHGACCGTRLVHLYGIRLFFTTILYQAITCLYLSNIRQGKKEDDLIHGSRPNSGGLGGGECRFSPLRVKLPSDVAGALFLIGPFGGSYICGDGAIPDTVQRG